MVAAGEVEGEGVRSLEPSGPQTKEVRPADAQELSGRVRVEVANSGPFSPGFSSGDRPPNRCHARALPNQRGAFLHACSQVLAVPPSP